MSSSSFSLTTPNYSKKKATLLAKKSFDDELQKYVKTRKEFEAQIEAKRKLLKVLNLTEVEKKGLESFISEGLGIIEVIEGLRYHALGYRNGKSLEVDMTDKSKYLRGCTASLEAAINLGKFGSPETFEAMSSSGQAKSILEIQNEFNELGKTLETNISRLESIISYGFIKERAAQRVAQRRSVGFKTAVWGLVLTCTLPIAAVGALWLAVHLALIAPPAIAIVAAVVGTSVTIAGAPLLRGVYLTHTSQDSFFKRNDTFITSFNKKHENETAQCLTIGTKDVGDGVFASNRKSPTI